MPAKPKGEDVPIVLKKLEKHTINLAVMGKTPLIVNRWSEKARKMMLASQMGGTRAKKEARDPEADFEASMHRFADGGHGFPATGFKAAIINSISLFEGVTKVAAKQALTVIGEGPDQLVRLRLLSEPKMREDTVRNASGVADLRFRAEYWPWAAEVTIEYLPRVLDSSSVVSLLDAAGFGGIGEWRPASKVSTTGTYGTFETAGDGYETLDIDALLESVE